MSNALNLRLLWNTRSRISVRNTYTHYFGSRGRTAPLEHRDLADRDPFVLVNSFNHDSAATSTVVLGAAIPEAFHRLPCFNIFASVNNKFSSVPLLPSWPSNQLPDCVP